MRRTVYASLAVVPLIAVALYLGSPGSSQPPLSATLRILPPVGSDRIEPARDALLDQSLTDLLRVTICRRNRFGACEPVEVFTSTSGSRQKDAIRLEGRRYRVVWKPDKKAARSTYEFHFDVAGLEIGFIEYAVRTRRAVPLAFTIDRHPRIRSRALHAQELAATENALALKDEFGLDAAETTELLSDEEYPLPEIASALSEVYSASLELIASLLRDRGYTPLEVAEALHEKFSAPPDHLAVVLREAFGSSLAESAFILDELGFESLEIAQALQAAYGFGDDPIGLAQALREIGYDGSEIYAVLELVFDLDVSAIYEILLTAGFTPEQALVATRLGLARKFAPQLRFDHDAHQFPMSADVYYKEIIESGYYLDPPEHQRPNIDYAGHQYPHMSNRDFKTLADPKKNDIPLYFKTHSCGEQLRIVYWWFFGHQEECCTFGKECAETNHHGDWERIMVILSEDKTDIAAVVYGQAFDYKVRLYFDPTGPFDRSGGWYTRVAGVPRVEEDGQPTTHPIVYVGKTGHAAYHNEGGWWGGCYYYNDYRNNQGYHLGVQKRLDGWKNVVSLHSEGGGYAERWIEAEQDPATAPAWWQPGQTCEQAYPGLCFKWGFGYDYYIFGDYYDLKASHWHPSLDDSWACGMSACKGNEGGGAPCPLGIGVSGCSNSNLVPGPNNTSCEYTECQRGDRDDNVSRCYHCGTDTGTLDGKWCKDHGLTCWCSAGNVPPIDWYEYEYSIPQTDAGLAYKDPNMGTCGIGPELALLLPGLWWLRRRKGGSPA